MDQVGGETVSALMTNPTNEPGQARVPEEGIGLCLSGGGYRAMLFHLGTLWRLVETDQLRRLQRISSVSGGSITAATLALAWGEPGFDPTSRTDFIAQVVAPVRALAGHTIDIASAIEGIALPGSIADYVAGAYRKRLFGDATLQDLPDTPRFVINASSVQTGALWRFSKPYMGDWHVGRILAPTLDLASAVAASSAFPPFLSPMTIDLDPASFEHDEIADLQCAPFTRQAVLSDGGVYDNLGLETVWKRYRTVLVSDAGMKISPEGSPPSDWARGAKRVADIIDNQVRSLRYRQLMGSFAAPKSDINHREGAYWSIRSDITHYAAPSSLACPVAATEILAATPTRLAALTPDVQEKLINWGYAICDVALRTHFHQKIPPARSFPYARGV